MSAKALRKIEAELLRLANEPDPIDHAEVRLAAIRIGKQAEMIEEGLIP
jgi:hypothetical protein